LIQKHFPDIPFHDFIHEINLENVDNPINYLNTMISKTLDFVIYTVDVYIRQ